MLGLDFSGNRSHNTVWDWRLGREDLGLIWADWWSQHHLLCGPDHKTAQKKSRGRLGQAISEAVCGCCAVQGKCVPFVWTVVWYRAIPCRSMSSALGVAGPSADSR